LSYFLDFPNRQLKIRQGDNIDALSKMVSLFLTFHFVVVDKERECSIGLLIR
jgi:hypothetical protein